MNAMGLARKLQPVASDGVDAPSGAASSWLPGDWQRAEGTVALLAWDDLADGLAAVRSDLVDAWLTLISGSNGAHLLLLRAGWLVTVAPPDDPLLPDVGFVWTPRPGEWMRRVQPHDTDAIVRVLKGPLQVPHPRTLRFGVLAPDAAHARTAFGPVREQQRRKGVGKVRMCVLGPVTGGPPCRRCGRPLVDPASRARGYGPPCWASLQRR